MANPFAKYAQPTEAIAPENPFAKYAQPTVTPQVETPEEPALDGYATGTGEIIPPNLAPNGQAEGEAMPGTPVSQLDHNAVVPADAPQGEDLNAQLNADREAGAFESAPAPEALNPLQSNSDLYGRIENDPKYEKLREYEGGMGRQIASRTLGGFGGELYDKAFQPDDIATLSSQRSEEKLQKFSSTGEESSLFGFPIRTQEKRENNPNYDANLPESDDNPSMVSTRYIVDPPEANALQRMAYQVLQNVAGGVGDFVTEGKITGEGAIGKALPETVPNHMGEKFATDVATYAVGGVAADKLIMGGGGALFGKVARAISPEAKTAIRETYAKTLAATGNEALAKKASIEAANGVIAGFGLGVRSTPGMQTAATAARVGNLSLAEGVVSPEDASGGVIPSSYFEKNWGMSKERADDMSFLADGPLMSATLSTFGAIRNAAVDKLITPAFGGLRNMKPIGFDINKIPGMRLGDKAAGIKFMTWLDPGIQTSSPEQAIHRMKLMADTVNRHGTKNMQLMGAGRAIPQDTASSFNEAAKDYFSIAYADQKAIMNAKDPKAFDNWVDAQAADASMRLYKLRTAMGSAGTSSKGVKELQGLLDDATNSVHKDGLVGAQKEAAQVAGQKNINDMEAPQIEADAARKAADEAKIKADTAMSNDPEFGMELRKANNTLGSNTELQKVVSENINPKLIAAQTKLKTESDDAYKAIADTGAEGDPVSLLQIIKETGDVGPGDMPLGMGPPSPKTTLHDPFLKQIAESVEADPSIGNIYNNVRNQISDQISAAQKSGDPQGRLQTLYKLRDNINETQLDHVAQGGDDNIKKMVEDAKDKYVKYQNAFYGNKNSSLQSVADDGEQIIRSSESRIPRGKGDYDIGVSRYVNNNLSTTERNTYARDIEHAASEGGQDIRPDIDNLYLGKAVNNLSDSLAKGGAESISTLRGSLSNIIENLERTNHPSVKVFKDMEAKINTLGADAKAKDAVAKEMKEAADELTANAQQSIFHNFVTKSRKGLVPVEGSDAGRNLEQLFAGKNGETKIKGLMDEVDEMGESGKVIRDAAQGTYVRWLKGKITGNSKMDMVAPDLGFAKRSNDRQIDKMFDDEGHDFAVMREVFRDKPEVVDALEDLSDTYQRISKKTPQVDKSVLFGRRTLRSENPQAAVSTLIHTLLGRLNRKSATTSSLITPMTVESLEEVEANMKSLVNMMVEDPDFASELMKSVTKDQVSKQQRKRAGEILRRATFRSYQSNEERGFIPAARSGERMFSGAMDSAKGILGR